MLPYTCVKTVNVTLVSRGRVAPAQLTKGPWFTLGYRMGEKSLSVELKNHEKKILHQL